EGTRYQSQHAVSALQACRLGGATPSACILELISVQFASLPPLARNLLLFLSIGRLLGASASRMTCVRKAWRHIAAGGGSRGAMAGGKLQDRCRTAYNLRRVCGSYGP